MAAISNPVDSMAAAASSREPRIPPGIDGRIKEIFAGVATVFQRDPDKPKEQWKPLKVEVWLQKLSGGRQCYRLYRERECIGEMTLVFCRLLADGKYGCENSSSPTTWTFQCRLNYREVGEGEDAQADTSNKIEILHIRSHRRHLLYGTGNALYQIAVEHGNRLGCEGRVVLDADGSHDIHFRAGFRAVQRRGNQALAAALKAGKEVRMNQPLNMFLDSEGREKFAKRIAEAPILTAFKDS